MTHKVPFVRIDHPEGDSTAYFYEVLFIIEKKQDVYLRSYPYKDAKAKTKSEEIITILDDDDIVVEHTYKEDQPGFCKAIDSDLGGWFNKSKKSIYTKPLTSKRVYVLADPDSVPTNKPHNGTIHWPGGD